VVDRITATTIREIRWFLERYSNAPKQVANINDSSTRDFYSLCIPFTHKPVVLCLHFFALPHAVGSQWHTRIAVAHCVATESLLAALYSAYYHFRSKCWSCQLKYPTDQAARKFCELQRTQEIFTVAWCVTTIYLVLVFTVRYCF
jgi:hypothetical protein